MKSKFDQITYAIKQKALKIKDKIPEIDLHSAKERVKSLSEDTIFFVANIVPLLVLLGFKTVEITDKNIEKKFIKSAELKKADRELLRFFAMISTGFEKQEAFLSCIPNLSKEQRESLCFLFDAIKLRNQYSVYRESQPLISDKEYRAMDSYQQLKFLFLSNKMHFSDLPDLFKASKARDRFSRNKSIVYNLSSTDEACNTISADNPHIEKTINGEKYGFEDFIDRVSGKNQTEGIFDINDYLFGASDNINLLRGQLKIFCSTDNFKVNRLELSTRKLTDQSNTVEQARSFREKNNFLSILYIPGKITQENAKELLLQVNNNISRTIHVLPNGDFSLLHEYTVKGNIHSEFQKFVLISIIENADGTMDYLYCNNSITPNSNRNSKKEVEKKETQNDFGGRTV